MTVIDGEAVPKIIDFGVAKATGQLLTDRTQLTGSDPFIGTPQYMSPEQAALSGTDIDTRSDIYSLGVLSMSCSPAPLRLGKERLKAGGVRRNPPDYPRRSRQAERDSARTTLPPISPLSVAPSPPNSRGSCGVSSTGSV